MALSSKLLWKKEKTQGRQLQCKKGNCLSAACRTHSGMLHSSSQSPLSSLISEQLGALTGQRGMRLQPIAQPVYKNKPNERIKLTCVTNKDQFFLYSLTFLGGQTNAHCTHKYNDEIVYWSSIPSCARKPQLPWHKRTCFTKACTAQKLPRTVVGPG